MRTTRAVAFASAALVAATLVPAAPASAFHRGNRVQSRPVTRAATSIDVCCAWGPAIKDGISYSISGPSRARQIMGQAVRSWGSAVKGLKLTEVSPMQPADVRLSFRSLGGNTQGKATMTRDRRTGLMQRAEVTAAGSYNLRPNSDEILAQITRHEFGHALGVGHANGDGDLMSPTLNGGAQSISACDVRAVRAANEWYFAGAAEPYRPKVSRVRC